MGSVNCVRFSIVALISCYNSKTCKKTKVNWKKLNRYECDLIGYLSPYVALWWSILMFSFLMYIEGNLTHHFSFTWISNNHHIHVYLLHLSNCQFYFIFFHLWFFFLSSCCQSVSVLNWPLETNLFCPMARTEQHSLHRVLTHVIVETLFHSNFFFL